MNPPKTDMKALKPISSFRLASLLRQEKDPKLALNLFNNPNPNQTPNAKTLDNSHPKPKPFCHSLLCYDLIITKLGRAKMFDEMQQILLQLKTETRLVPNESLLCSIIGFYAHARLPKNALNLFDEIPSYRCQRTIKSFNSLVNVLMTCREFDTLKELLMNIERHGKADACTYHILIRGCCESGRIHDAWKLFDEMTKRGIRPNNVTFGTLVNGLCSGFRLKEVFKLKEDMIRVYGVLPDKYVYLSLVKGLFGIGQWALALRLKDEMVRNMVEMDSAVFSTLISGLFKAGKEEEGTGVLEEMKLRGFEPDRVTYNVMIWKFCRDKDFEKAYGVLDEMVKKGCKLDVVGYNVILRELCKNGKWSEAYDLFQDMPRRGCAPDVVSYRIVFDGLSDSMQFNEAEFVLDEMIFKGFNPRSESVRKFLCRLCVEKNLDLLCSTMDSLGKGNAVHAESWGIAINMVVKDAKASSCFELLDDLLCHVYYDMRCQNRFYSITR